MRDVWTTVVALFFVFFIFTFELTLHEYNFCNRGLSIFTICPIDDNNSVSGKVPQVLITKRAIVSKGDSIIAYRLSNTVFLEI